ncbi:molybdate transport system substrate-binding protein [Lentzea atacamensis]|uniref:Molybdate-binding protein ModA n=2 Tax=Lentzea TaxID=165301 RepID=A0A316I3J0_9PSEU|nr:molybdate ABC transporter substrate-binding protein [Lentzea atacamensis]PWK87966.1 molybdate transport system substrate-binding protein [Lentzea atacamensis]
MKRVLVLTLLLAGCGSPAATSTGGDITVFAAASLSESFTKLGTEFEAAHPGSKVRFSFAGSSALAQQINQGAPADVFAAAAPANMKQVTDTGAVTATPATFARNTLQIAVPRGNPGRVTGLADFAKADLKIALCAEQVPCGATAKKVFEAAGVKAAPDTLEQDVKAVLTKVSLGEVDAALVYRTDVRAAGGKVEGEDFAEAAKAVNDYPVAPLAKAPNAPTAKAFVDFVLSGRGREVLIEAGFSAP